MRKDLWALLVAVFMGIVFFSINCSKENPTVGGGGKVDVTIKYYPGIFDFSSAYISVNGENYCTVSKNSTKYITVDNGARLLAEYVNYEIYPYTGVNQSRSTTASDKLIWSIP